MKTPEIMAKRIKEYLSSGKRFDGRGLNEFRDLEIEMGVSKNAEGSARVKLGDTEVLVGVKMDITAPYPDSKNKGNLMVTAEFLPLSSSRFELGPPKIESIELARIIDRAIRESKFIELDKLCLVEGEKVWNVMIDIYTINEDGNLLDAAGIGAIAALKNTMVPTYNAEEEKVVYGEPSGNKLPTKKDVPISITFHKIGEGIVVDPTREEEDISEARITIGSYDGVISSMQKGNESSLSEEEMFKILDSVEEVRKGLYSKMEKFLK